MNKYSKNAILCGEVDFFCLLCSEIFQSLSDVERHIRWENHRKKLKDNKYDVKFKNELIIKIGSNFFCEICNTVMPTAVKTTLHIKNQTHIDRKQQNGNEELSHSNPLVKRDSGSILIKDVVLNEQQWHGIVDNQCILCDVDVEDGHLNLPSHAINLIQTKTKCTDGNNVYRKIGADIFYCFSCKQVYSLIDIDIHWSTKEHSDNKKKISSQQVNNGASSSRANGTFSNEFKNNMKKMFASSSAPKTNQNHPDIRAEKFENENFVIDYDNAKAVCQKCNFSPAFTVKAIKEHMKLHKRAENGSVEFQQQHVTNGNGHANDENEWETDSDVSGDTDADYDDVISFIFLDHGKRRSELAKFGKKHYMKLVSNGSKGYCDLCNTYISAHIKNFKQHIKGAKHIGFLEQKGLIKKTTKKEELPEEHQTVLMSKYVKNISLIEDLSDFWINRSFCIDTHSFVLLSPVETNGKHNKFKCLVCDVTIPKNKDHEHCDLDEHKKKLQATKVLVSLKNEFVREIKPNLYHCGFCNNLLPSWATMKKHLSSIAHRQVWGQQKLVAAIAKDINKMEESEDAFDLGMFLRVMAYELGKR